MRIPTSPSQFYKTALFSLTSFLFLLPSLRSQTIWLEDFSGANQGWTASFTDCDGLGSFGVANNRFEVTDQEGSPCCAAGGGSMDNIWETNPIDIQGYCAANISVQYGAIGVFECVAGGPFFGCTNNVAIDNGHDQMVFEYSINGGPYVQFFYLCGGGAGTATANGLVGNNIRIRIQASNKAIAETYWFDNVTVTGVAPPTVNPVNDITVCAGSPVAVNFTGTGGPTFNWTNSNPAIGLGASGTGNINFTPPSSLATQQVATITVTPVAASCTGTPITFDITVNPLPLTNDPPDLVICSGDFVQVIFSGSDPGADYHWTVNLPLFPPSGTGDFSGTVPTIPFPVSGTVTVHAESNGCIGPNQTFTVSAYPAITANMTLTSNANICSGQSASFSVDFAGGVAPYTFVYSINGVNQAPVTTSNDPYTFTVPNLTADATIAGESVSSGNGTGCSATPNGSYNINVTPTPTATLTAGSSSICSGQSVDLTVTFNGSGNYNLVYRINGVSQPPVSATGPTYTLTLMPNIGTNTITLASVSDNGCPGTVSGSYTINVVTAPTANISGTQTICAGQAVNVQITFTGTGPYTFVYSLNGVAEPPVTVPNSPYSFNATYNLSTTIELESVTNASCMGMVSGTAQINVLPGPIGSLNGSATICTGQSGSVPFHFAGTPPFNFVYAVNGVNQPALVANDTIYQLSVTPGITSTYTLVSVASGACTGTVSGQFVVNVTTPPTGTIQPGPYVICQGDTAFVMVDVSGGTPPYTIMLDYNGNMVGPFTGTIGPIICPMNPPLTGGIQGGIVSSGNCSAPLNGSTFILVNPRPTAVLEADTVSYCAGTVDTLTVKFTGTQPFVFQYQANDSIYPPITVHDTLYQLIVTPGLDTTRYKLVSVTDTLCPMGLVGGSYLVVTAPAPSGVLSGDTTVCAGDSSFLKIVLTGGGPYTIDYTANGVAQTPLITSDSVFLYKIGPLATTTYVLTGVSNGCNGPVSGQAVVNVTSAPFGTLSGGGQICQNGGGTDLIFSFSGPTPYTFVYSANNMNQPPVTVNTATDTIHVNPPNGTIYHLISLTNGGPCPGVVSGQAVVFVFSPGTATLPADQTFCDSADTTIPIDFTGTGPFAFVYSIDGVIQDTVDTFDDPYLITLNTTTTTVYGLHAVQSPGCYGNVLDTLMTVTVNHTPTYSNVNLNCNPAGNNFTVEFDVTGTGPFTVVTGDGFFTGNHFNSNPIAQGMGYTIVFHDAANCNDVTVSGLDNCNCATDAGTMSQTPLSGCAGSGPITGMANGDGALEGNDVLQFIIHDQPGLPVGTIYGFNSTPQFDLLAGMTVGTTYYISAIAGNDDGTGAVDMNDPCLSVATGQPVSFLAPPTASLGSNDTICAGAPVLVPVALTGVATFTLTYALNGVAQAPVSGINSLNANLSFSPMANTELTLISIADANCSAMVQDTVEVAVNTAPQFSNLSVNCDASTQMYTVAFDLTGQPPFNIMGLTGSFSGSHFTSLPIVAANNYSVTLTDGTGCGQDSIAGVSNCGCLTDAGTMSQSLVIACENGNLTVPVTAGATPDNNDAVLYILHDQPGQPVGNIFAWNNQPTFTLQAGMTTGTTYYISAIAGNNNGNGQVDLNDPCLSVAAGTPVQFHPLPSAVLSSLDTTICFGDIITLSVNFSGTPPFSFTYSVNGVAQAPVTNIVGNNYAWLLGPTQQTTVQLLTVGDQYCTSGTVQGLATIGVGVTEAGTFPSQQPLTLCAGDTAVLQETQNAILSAGDTLVYLLTTGTNPATWTVIASNSEPTFVFNGANMSAGTAYNVIAIAGNTAPTGVDPNDPCLDFAIGTTVSWRIPVTASLNGFAEICQGDTTYFAIQFSGGAPYNFTYSANGITQNPLISNGNTFQLQVIPLNTVTFDLISVSSGGCAGTASGTATVQVDVLNLVEVEKICDFAAQTYTLQFKISNGAVANDTYTVNGVAGTVNDSIFTSSAIAFDTPYDVTVSNSIGCTAVISGVSDCHCVSNAGTLNPSAIDACTNTTATVTVNGDAQLDPDDKIQYILYEDPATLPMGIVATSDQPQFSFQAGMVAEQTYYISAIVGTQSGSSVDVTDPCLSVSPGVPVVFHTPPTADLVGDTSICAGGSATFPVTLTGNGPFQLTYAIDGNNQPVANVSSSPYNLLASSVQQPSTYTLVSVQDAYCAGTVSGSAAVDLIPAPTASITADQTICAGGSAGLVLHLSGGTNYTATISGGGTPLVLNNATDGMTFFVSPTQTTTYTISNLSVTGNVCPVDIGTGATITVSNLTATATLSDFGGGFNISCPEAGDGSISLNTSGGITPVTALWNTGDTGLDLAGLDAGAYSVTLTDGNGCTYTEDFALVAPPGLLIDISVLAPKCAGEESGALTIESLVGGAQPYSFTLNDLPVASPDSLPFEVGGLGGGQYLLFVTDANGCVIDTLLEVPEPSPITVDLGPDLMIHLGDSVLLQGFVSTGLLDTFIWSPLEGLYLPDALTTFAKPTHTATYQLWVQDMIGCTGQDEIVISVDKTKRVYVPNIMMPSSTDLNNLLTVYGGPEVAHVRFLRVYDRWGECVFETSDFSPNDRTVGWDGRHKGKDVNPGVYVYVTEVDYVDGTSEVLSGDITVAR